MREISGEFLEKLKGTSLLACDWYTLILNDGRIFRMNNTDHDVFVGEDIWYHNFALVKREQIKTQSELTVATMTVTIYAGLNDYIGTDHILKAAHDGLLDRANLTFGRAFFRDDNMKELLGFFVLFSGITEIKKAGGLELSLTVKANTQSLNANFPIRRYYPQATYENVGGTVIEGDGSEETGVIAPYVPRKEVLM